MKLQFECRHCLSREWRPIGRAELAAALRAAYRARAGATLGPHSYRVIGLFEWSTVRPAKIANFA